MQIIGLLIVGALFAAGFKISSKHAKSKFGQIAFGIFLGLFFCVGLVAVLIGILFAGCALSGSSGHF
jgi:hypothetical protein